MTGASARTADTFELHHVGIVVSDLEKAVAFYAQHLGLIPESVSPWALIPGKPLGLDGDEVKLRWAFMRLGSTVIEIHEFDGPFQSSLHRTTDQPGVGHLALKVPDIHSARRRLTEAGITFYSDPNILDLPGQDGDQWVYGKDPFGVTIELYQQAERTQNAHE
ncbi:VOC family protein [Arthrobacter sp. NPDC093128]|uniref:VOC family protein n=1 Tax=Arthrobacter sp. NPDC093128 TaxID=3154979 RepID=UPI003434DE4E